MAGVTVRAVLGPLVRGTTYRRGVFLLLGGVLLLPYVLLGVVFTQMLTAPVGPRLVILLLLAVAAGIAGVPVFLGGSRALEIAAARALLDVNLPEPATGHGIDRETRLRSALWIALHLVTGGLLMFGLISAFPMALVFIWQQLGIGTDAFAGQRFGPFDEHDSGWLALAGVVLLVAIIYSVAGLGALARLMAPVLLGPSQTERIAALEARAGQLAERNRLARELHDSVGHALTVATVQAGAARELLDTDPDFARRALRAIEDTSRAAMDDLDHVLGLLRERETEHPDGAGENSGGEAQHRDRATAQTDRAAAHTDRTTARRDDAAGRPGRAPVERTPQRTLGDLDRLVDDTRATGLPVTVEVTGAVGELPAAVSREGYRIVQEGLTNAVRHGGRQPVMLRVGVPVGGLEIELVNAVTEGSGVGAAGPGRVGARAGGATRGGRGLAGMRERVLLLGGRMTAGPDDGTWRVSVRLPTERGEEPM
jgi:signal transduction histidine kinase